MMEEYYEMNNYEFVDWSAAENFDEIIENTHMGKIWMISFTNQTIGYLIFTFGYSFEHGGRDASIDELFLKKEYRNKGFGTLILETLDFFAHKHNVKAIHLKVENTDSSANQLYLKAGYTKNRRHLLTKTI